jgi:hypothetical protein
MPRPLPDPSPGTIARLRQVAEQLRTKPDVTPDGRPSAATDYDGWTLARLRRRATELDIEDRSTMDKAALIAALRALPPETDAATTDTATGDG